MRTRRLIPFLLVLFSAIAPALAQPYGDSRPRREIDRALFELEETMHRSCDPDAADKAEDAIAKLETAGRELAKRPPDDQAAAGNLEGAIGDLEAAVYDKCFDPETGIGVMDDLTAIARDLALGALDAAHDYGRRRDDFDELQDARRALSRGDALRDAGRRGRLEAFKQAVGSYKDALSKAESALR